MKDRFLYLTIGVLVGVVVTQWMTGRQAEVSVYGPSLANASVVDPTLDVVAIAENQVLDRLGNSWDFPGDCWNPGNPLFSVPIPVADIKFWTPVIFLAKNGDLWRNTTGAAGWVNCGPWPGAPVPTSEDSWGSVKDKYKGKD